MKLLLFQMWLYKREQIGFVNKTFDTIHRLSNGKWKRENEIENLSLTMYTSELIDSYL